MRVLVALLLTVSLAVPLVARADEAVERARESVVTIYTYRPSGPFAAGAGRQPDGAGSGWVYGDGLVVTNAHVVDGAEEITVVTSAGDLVDAEVLGSDWYQDVAVLRLDDEDADSWPAPLDTAASADVAVGAPVVAIGTPHGQFLDTVSEGAVLAVDQRINTGQGYSVLNLIQHSALLAPGNSGGPLVDAGGEVIGMNVASRRFDDGEERAPIGFAIAMDAVVPLVEEIVATGAVARPWLGVTTGIEDGATVVWDVEEGSPADVAGLEVRDRIVAVDDVPITRSAPFIDLLYRHEPGDEIVLGIERAEAEMTVTLTLASR